ncbi:Mitochondrial Rho GTPase 2 [Linum grandiflorum]
MAGGSSASGGRTGVRVVVAGDRFTGKSSLIAAAATESYPENVTHVLPPTHLPADFFPDRVPITIIDTSAAPWNGAPYKDTAETTSQGNLTLMGFLSEVCMSSISKVVLWSCPLRVTRRKSVDRKKHTTERSVFNCFVLGPESAGKSSILNAFLGR